MNLQRLLSMREGHRGTIEEQFQQLISAKDENLLENFGLILQSIDDIFQLQKTLDEKILSQTESDDIAAEMKRTAVYNLKLKLRLQEQKRFYTSATSCIDNSENVNQSSQPSTQQQSHVHTEHVTLRKMSLEVSTARPMYPDIEPYDTDMLRVSDIHQVYYEQSGSKTGNPVIFLHGGPGAGTSPRDRTFFDPEAYRIILMDQRGAGRSTPSAELKENTTWNLVSDIEKLRENLGIEKWVVFGGSWGSTLSLAYAQSHPDRVKALILRGIFTLRRRELIWYFQDGASFILPDAFEDYVKPIPEVERGDLMGAYYRRLTSGDEKVQLECAKAWTRWEMATSGLYIDQQYMAKAEVDTWALQFATIECHYFVHGGFFEREDQLLANVDKIRHIPTTIVQGRYDTVCPMDTAWKLHRAFPEADFHIVPDAGHGSQEPGTQTKLLEACDKYKNL